jgi:hypothetical protein
MSFWDCGEYIATAAKLQVESTWSSFISNDWRVLCMFAIDNQHIALMVNMTSVFSSAFTILFLFWSSSIILKN